MPITCCILTETTNLLSAVIELYQFNFILGQMGVDGYSIRRQLLWRARRPVVQFPRALQEREVRDRAGS